MNHSLDQRFAEEKEQRAWIVRLRRESAETTRDLVREAIEEGWSKTHIAQVAGISRQTVHEMLKD
jgi:DNA invertase Pin-like site-specific DNA recombinase